MLPKEQAGKLKTRSSWYNALPFNFTKKFGLQKNARKKAAYEIVTRRSSWNRMSGSLLNGGGGFSSEIRWVSNQFLKVVSNNFTKNKEFPFQKQGKKFTL